VVEGIQKVKEGIVVNTTNAPPEPVPVQPAKSTAK
jgi:hypothetical protein